MTAAERLKKRFKGGVPHKAKKEEKFFAGLMPGLMPLQGRAPRKRKSGRNETDSSTRKRGYDFF